MHQTSRRRAPQCCQTHHHPSLNSHRDFRYALSVVYIRHCGDAPKDAFETAAEHIKLTSVNQLMQQGPGKLGAVAESITIDALLVKASIHRDRLTMRGKRWWAGGVGSE